MDEANDLRAQRSSSPLKRPASSMEQTFEATTAATPPSVDIDATTAGVFDSNAKEDVDMISLPPAGDGSERTAKLASPAPQNNSSPQDMPPIDEQIRIVEDLVRSFNTGELEEGTAAYLVSRRWLSRAQALGSGGSIATNKNNNNNNKAAAKEELQTAPGAVDNADLIDSIVSDIDGAPAVRLRPSIIGQESFEYFPKQAWDLLMSWHGLAKGQLPIVRYAHNTAPNSLIPNVQYELHPPVFTFHRLWSAISGIPHDREVPDVNLPAPVFMCSSNCNIQTFLKRAKTLLYIPMSRRVRMWRVPRKLAASDNPAASTSSPLPSSLTSLSTPPASPPSPKLGNAAGSRSSGGGTDPNNPQDSWSNLLLEVTDFMKLQNSAEREQLQVTDSTHNENFNGKSTLAFISLVVDQTIVLDENVERNFYVSTYNPKSAGKDKTTANVRSGYNRGASPSSLSLPGSGTAVVNRSNAATSTATSSGRSSPGPVTRGRAKRASGRVPGCVGLSNLGNTCYMNSALQCLRSVEELTKYFLVHENEREINEANPLGHGGNVANAYAHLLEEIYKDTVPSSISPRNFKTTIGRFAPSFSGYGQQDSQEFLGFLLDGLQEDLSRVRKKPYIAKPDSTDEMINNPAAIREMAEKVWDITKRRDDSIIADLFTGLYKSTLICPVCQKVSITFDPFTNLTLPLPIQNVWAKSVRFVPLNDRPVTIEVELDKTSSVRALKEFVGVRVGVPADRLVSADESSDSIYKVYDDFRCVAEEMRNISTGTVVVYELESAPTNPAAGKLPPKRYRPMTQIDKKPEIPNWDSPMAERLLVPVIHRLDPTLRPRYARGSSLVCPPHFIVLTPHEARSEDRIRRKILEKVASFSTWPGFADADSDSDADAATKSPAAQRSANGHSNNSAEDDGTDTTDNDLVVANASDADSAGDGKVVAKSVEGEDDLVDVTMKDASGVQNPVAGPSPKVLYKINHHRPKWATDPSVYLTGEMQSFFKMSYYDDGTNIIPINWSSAHDDKIYPELQSRMRQPDVVATAADQEGNSPSTWESAAGSENESSQEETPTEAAVYSDITRMADESDEEDSVLPAAQHLAFRNSASSNKRGHGRRKPVKSHQKTYGNKGAKRRQQHLHSVAMRHHHHQQEDPDQIVSGHDSDANEDENLSREADDSQAAATACEDDGPLVRLGEGVIVDWHPEACELVFGKENPDDNMRGEATFVDPLPIVEDKELQEKRQQRLSRRKRGLTLDECLDEFEREEILSENDTWYCPRCKEHRRASKKFDLWKTPDILVVHLKRFSSSGWRRDKLDTRVAFPVEGLDLTKRVLDRQTGKQEIYDLIGVDDHWGGLGGGHYTAFAQNFVDHQWYEYNDSSVSKVSDVSRVVSSAAYLLFYRRRSEVPLGGPRFQKIEEKYNREHDAAGSDDDMSDSGEGQRLDTGSSLIGLSSASKGAEAGLRRRASPGLASSGTSSLTLNAQGGASAFESSPAKASTGRRGGNHEEGDEDEDDELLPPYVASPNDGGVGLTGTHNSVFDVDSGDEYDRGLGGESSRSHTRFASSTNVLNFGGAGGDDTIHKSIEMEDRFGSGNSGGLDSTSWTQQSWSFAGAGVRSSPGSDVADVDELELDDATGTEPASGAPTMHDDDDNDNGNADRMSLGTGTGEHRDDGHGLSSFSSTAATVDAEHDAGDGRAASPSPPPPPPDSLTLANMEDIQQQAWARKEQAGRLHTIALAADDEASSDKAVDIHVGSEDETTKMNG